MSPCSWTAFVFLAFGALFACEAASSDDTGDAPPDAGGATCATYNECTDPARPHCSAEGRCVPARSCDADDDCIDPYFGKCSQTGTCIAESACETDADCRDDFKHCHGEYHQCQPCLSDSHCPSETPVCVPGWEYGLYCAACRPGDSSNCPDGTWCTPMFTPHSGGNCQTPHCGEDPMDQACVACVNENATSCRAPGGACADELETLSACYLAEDPTWSEDNCPVGVPWDPSGCSPEACAELGGAFEACIFECAEVTEPCGV